MKAGSGGQRRRRCQAAPVPTAPRPGRRRSLWTAHANRPRLASAYDVRRPPPWASRRPSRGASGMRSDTRSPCSTRPTPSAPSWATPAAARTSSTTSCVAPSPSSAVPWALRAPARLLSMSFAASSIRVLLPRPYSPAPPLTRPGADMTTLLAQVRTSMSSARRTDPIAHDWLYALATAGLRGSAALHQHLDTGELPPALVQPPCAPSAPPAPPPPDTHALLGVALSGQADKDARFYIPRHFPAFPSKHTYKATPVFTRREHDPRTIREKATEEGILAEQSLRKLMAAQKAGIQKQNLGKRKRSKRITESGSLWQETMVDLLAEEKARDGQDQQRRAQLADDEQGWDAPVPLAIRHPASDRNVNLDEGLHVNYEQKYWRRLARGT